MRLRWLPALAWIAVLAAIPLFFLPRNPETKKIQEALPAKENEVALPTQAKPGEAPIQVSDTPTPPVDVAKVTANVAAPKPEAVAPPAASAPLRDESLARADKTAVLEQKMKAGVPVTREELAAAGAERDASVQRVSGRNRVSQVTETRQISATPAAASASAPAPASAEVAANSQRLSFVNVVATPQALNNFQIEQVGARFKVLDADGSVYPGRALTNGTFHVAGMNKTLNKPVVFTGQVTVANAPVSNFNVQELANNYRAQNVQNFPNVQNQSVSNNNAANVSQDVRLQGQATVGSVQYKIDAQGTPTQ
jgi:hypothetical protein